MTDDGERVASPEETLRLIETQRATAVRALHGDPLLLYTPWGVAWLLGFGALFLRYGLDGVPYAPISHGAALGVHLSLQVVAGAFAATGIVRMSSQVRGESSAKGMMYGYAWFVGMVLMSVICARFSSALDPLGAGLLWAGVSLLVVAVLYMAGGALFGQWPMFFMGVWVAAVNGLGVILGAGWHALLSAVLLGGGQIAAGILLRRRA
ncbi:hypothetical protein OUY22_03995 [Nonomuraea sp. MCN248]|uniref:Transporter n=1 Tax=Nonomuraea corallina TaxID=2989783 RepID=A0ABT4S5V0_9ACTN|nr:hypothetical protein [Nonomuraea corallina]MDA0632567.1 hypothetical protein [Nonomuraea corallina]